MTEVITIEDGEWKVVSEKVERKHLKWSVSVFYNGERITGGERGTPVTAKSFKDFIDSEKALIKIIGKIQK